MIARHAFSAALAGAAALMASSTLAQNADWPAYGGDPGGTRYSTLTQIDKSNVARLTQAWRFDMPAGGLEYQPIMVGRTLYVGTTDGKMVALDAATGQTKWTHAYGATVARMRGVSYWADGADHRLLVTTGSAVRELNADTGQQIMSFGTGGQVDLNANLRGPASDNKVNMGSPPMVYKNVFVTHGGVPENSPSSPGDIRGWDVRTGKLLWTFHTIPHPGEPGAETWPKDAYLTQGGANAWTGVIIDEKNGIVFAATGEPADDFWGGNRAGDNLYGDSLLAIDAASGKLLWYFQAVHHGGWDADFAAPPALITVTHDGKKVDAVVATNKLGFIYLFDRKTGKSLFPIDEVAVPPSNAPGERSAATQPVPRLPYPIARQGVTSDSLTTRTPEANAWARAKLATMVSSGKQFTPPAYNQETIAAPGYSGGVEWGGFSVDPAGIMYANSEDIAWATAVVDQPRPGPGKTQRTFTGYHKFDDPDGYPAVSTPWGTLNAIDMNTGQYLWRIPFGEYPELVAKGLKNTGSESYGGPVTTASGLLFIGATVYDHKFRAYESSTGRLLWETQLPYSGVATPATYMVDGRQYVVIAASSGRGRKDDVKGAAYVAFALPK